MSTFTPVNILVINSNRITDCTIIHANGLTIGNESEIIKKRKGSDFVVVKKTE